jgi:pimeloyl-ACP methyl ester carboxylesterase
MPEIDRDGVPIHYDVQGDGPALLLTHGYTSSSHMWAPQLPALGDRYRVITWDIRGHGRSGSPEDPADYAEDLAVGDMAAVLDAAGADRAAIGGLSLGGYLSLAFHLHHPSRTAALLLFDSGPGFKSDKARAGWNDLAEAYARDFEARGLDALPERGEVDRAVHRGAEGLARAARGLLAQRDARVIESLPAVAVPTLVLVGADDEPFLAGSGYMVAKIPGALHTVLEGAGHASNIDQPGAFNREVLAFLAGVSW